VGRIGARVVPGVLQEDEVFEMDRSELLSTYAEYLLSPPIPVSPEKAEGGAVGCMSAEEWEFRKQELELRKQGFEFQKERQEKEEERRKQEFEYQKERQQKEDVRREEDLDRQRQRDELELQRREEENRRRDRENEMRRRGSGKSSWRDKLVFMGTR